MINNDFQIVLVRYINSLNLPITARLDYFTPDNDLVVNAIPGGKVDLIYMDGTKEVSLPFEIAVKSKYNQKASNIIWQINTALSEFDIDLPSINGSYKFLDLIVDKPSINGKDEQDYFIYTLVVTAKLETN